MMLIVHVHVRVKPECVSDFIRISTENAQASIREPGVVRFDVIQNREDECRFVLVEIYRSENDPASHKEMAHYAKWKDAAAGMMAEPRSSIRYTAVFPGESEWE